MKLSPVAATIGGAAHAYVSAGRAWPLKSQHKVVKFPLLLADGEALRRLRRKSNSKNHKHHLRRRFERERSHVIIIIIIILSPSTYTRLR